MLEGFATAEGTAAYAARHRAIPYRVGGKLGLTLSAAGFGCYRVDAAITEHQAALRAALLGGVNVVDTSANYADGGSERLVGKILGELAAQGQVRREEIVIVSKAGYLQGSNYRLSQDRKQAGRPFPETVLYDEGLEHCIHPEFLEDQITRSLDRLQLRKLDCFLFHNPEYYLKWAQQNKLEKAAARREYLRRIEVAFGHLEQEVKAGRISAYGISSNTFPGGRNLFAFTPLSAIWEVAQAISPAHHFRVVEMPLNLMEPGAVTKVNQPQARTVLELAQEKGLTVLINRPLNAIRNDRLIRLDETVYQGEAARQAGLFRDTIAAINNDWQDVSQLRQLALLAVCSTPGAASVLVSMRREQYVADVLATLERLGGLETTKDIWQAIGSL